MPDAQRGKLAEFFSWLGLGAGERPPDVTTTH
jgi:hypothetical protein